MTVSAMPPKKIVRQDPGYCSTVSYRNNGSFPESVSAFDWNFPNLDAYDHQLSGEDSGAAITGVVAASKSP